MAQLTLEDYAKAQAIAVRNVRFETARELTEQAEDLLRTSEHMTFDSALALLERLRKEEPYNSGSRQRVSESLARAAQPEK